MATESSLPPGGVEPEPETAAEAAAESTAPAQESPSSEKEQVQEPEQIVCPITHVVYRDPVFVPDSGNTYECVAITQYWASSPPPRDPLTNVSLNSADLHTNWGVRREVQRFLDDHPGYVPQGWPDRNVPPPAQGMSSTHSWCAPDVRKSLCVVAIAGLVALLIQQFTEPVHEISPHFQELKVTGLNEVPPSQDDIHVASEEGLSERLPKGSRLQVSLLETRDALLVRLPANGRVAGEVLGQAVFAVFWLGFIAVWTAGAVRGGAPVVFGAFSIPFWGAGLMMLWNVAETLLASERLYLAHEGGALESSTSPVLVLETEMFGRALSKAHIYTEDLVKSPEIACDSSRACWLVFETNAQDHTWGSTASLRRGEARWLQKTLQSRLIEGARRVGTQWRQFQGQLQEKEVRNHDQIGSDGFNRHVGGFGGFAGVGPGFTFVVR